MCQDATVGGSTTGRKLKHLRQRSLERLRSVRDDLSVLRSMWFTKAQMRGGTHEERLNSFYAKNADKYDRFRLLQGRDRLMSAVAQRLPSEDESSEQLVWCDLGGGTAENIAAMERLVGLDRFKQIYVVDVADALCRVAERKCVEKGWTNVTVVHADAATFTPPEGECDLVTFGYSLTEMPSYHAVIEHTLTYLRPGGIVGSADFYVSSKFDSPLRQTPLLSRWLYRCAFDACDVDLGPERRQLLEHKLVTVHEYNGLGGLPYVPLFKVPYYVWVGCKSADPHFLRGLAAPGPVVRSGNEKAVHPPLIDFFPDSFLYSVSWEDPEPDRGVLQVGPGDRVLTLCAGACNCFEYLADGADQVVAVDMNPAQTHLLELKAVAVARLSYEDTWALFGEGKHPDAPALMRDQVFPFLSQCAADWWQRRLFYFQHGLYYYGGMGLMIWAIRVISRVFGMERKIHDLVHAETLEEQQRVWNSFWIIYAWKNMPRWLWAAIGQVTTAIFLSDLVMWFGAGVPKAQLKLITDKMPLIEYILRLFDALAHENHIKTDNYFYRLCLTGKFDKECCPFYLERDNFDKLKSSGALSRLHIETGTFQQELEKGTYTRAILMDHLDWLGPEVHQSVAKSLAEHIAPGGRIIWRSASIDPPYRKVIEDAGFDVQCVQAHSIETPYIDRVNMYASFYVGVRHGKPARAASPSGSAGSDEAAGF